jgi:hypothetical protein
MTMLSVPLGQHEPWLWEQGFIAMAYSYVKSHGLSAQRYFYPYHDGLPGGFLGYPYRENPCGFASIHFGGLRQKPNDTMMSLLVDEVLGGPS